MIKTGDRCITQLTKMRVDPKFVELAADVVTIFLLYIRLESFNRIGNVRSTRAHTHISHTSFVRSQAPPFTLSSLVLLLNFNSRASLEDYTTVVPQKLS